MQIPLPFCVGNSSSVRALKRRSLKPVSVYQNGTPQPSNSQQSASALFKGCVQPSSGWLTPEKQLIWQGNEEQALEESSPVSKLPPPWKVMLLSDGSVTRHLQLLTGARTHVECVQMEPISTGYQDLPPSASLISTPLVQRQVLLCSAADGLDAPLVYATSWWNEESVNRYLRDKSKPIWVSLSQDHMELYRDLQQVFLGESEELEQVFGSAGPFWGRQYLFWNGGRPLTLIHEVFSPRLQKYLGEIRSDKQPGDE